MNSITVNLGGFKITMQRYPTSRSVVPSQLQRELLRSDDLAEFARTIVAEHYARIERALTPVEVVSPTMSGEYPEVPTERKAYDVVPSLGADKWTGTEIPNLKEEPRYDARFDVHPLFTKERIFGLPIPPRCEHTDDEIREMAHKVHVKEQAEMIAKAVVNDPAFFGDEHTGGAQ